MTAPLFRWVAEAPGPLHELLWKHGLTAAMQDERVFVDGRRVVSKCVEPPQLAVGAVVEVFAPRPPALIDILHEADDVFALYKPAALPTEPDKNGVSCVLRQLAERVGLEPSNLFAVSRLDVGVSGVLLVAVGRRAHTRLLQERARGSLRRRYIALASGVPAPVEGEWREGLGRGRGGKRVVDGRDGQAAHSRYRVVATAQAVSRERPLTSLLSLSPVTGRTHQLRVHTSAHGAPILGDRKYSGPVRITLADGSVRSLSQILLHSARVEWGPASKRQLVVAEPCTDMVETWLALGGDSTALQRALD
jgi:23S rRNA-/tRNA-specific pseudouridylate synthase